MQFFQRLGTTAGILFVVLFPHTYTVATCVPIQPTFQCDPDVTLKLNWENINKQGDGLNVYDKAWVAYMFWLDEGGIKLKGVTGSPICSATGSAMVIGRGIMCAGTAQTQLTGSDGRVALSCVGAVPTAIDPTSSSTSAFTAVINVTCVGPTGASTSKIIKIENGRCTQS